MSQAPGLRGTPVAGHCSSAETSASCARSSARPTSRTMRARPAMRRADSILQTASIARWVSEAVTASDYTIVHSSGQPRPRELPLLEEVDRPDFDAPADVLAEMRRGMVRRHPHRLVAILR